MDEKWTNLIIFCVGSNFRCGQSDRAFFKKLQLLGLSLNEGLFPTQLRVHKGHVVQIFIRMGSMSRM
jgi:hypothetical protein